MIGLPRAGSLDVTRSPAEYLTSVSGQIESFGMQLTYLIERLSDPHSFGDSVSSQTQALFTRFGFFIDKLLYEVSMKAQSYLPLTTGSIRISSSELWTLWHAEFYWAGVQIL